MSSRPTEAGRRPRPAARLIAFLASLSCLLAASPAGPVERFVLHLERVEAQGWVLEGIEAELGLAGPAGRIRVARLRPPPGWGPPLEGLELRCARLELGPRWSCRGGRLRARPWQGWPVAARLEASWEAATGRLALDLSVPALAGGRWKASVRGTAGRWEALLEADGVDAARLQALAAALGRETGLGLQGRLQVRAEAAGRGMVPDRVAARLAAPALGFSDATGTRAAERLAVTAEARAVRRARGWAGSVQGRVAGGYLYVEPVGVDFDRWPARFRAQLTEAGDAVLVEDLSWDQPGVARLAGRARLPSALAGVLERLPALPWPDNLHALLAAVPELRLRLEEARLPGAYETLAQPWLYGTLAGDLGTSGRLSGELEVAGGRLAGLRLALDDLGLEDAAGRFGVSGLAGEIGWAADGQERQGHLAWRSGHLYRIPVGGARMDFTARNDRFALARPVDVPVLDGRLSIDTLEVERPGLPDMAWHFDAVLTPVSMPLLTEALGWPRMAGRLSGMIPHVDYRDGELRVGGVLLVNVFDGDVTVRNLRLLRPFGRVPELRADVQVRGIELERLTRTFEFGRIEGRVDGRIRGLVLQNWKPLAFDARFETPPGDESRHRISQRAIDNLSSIGGGLGGALSRSYLRFFEEFPYDRLGIACRLENGVCLMDGVAPVPQGQGYYLVKGRFLPPRIDIIGYNRRVDWAALVARVKAAIEEGGPTVR